MYRTYGLRGVNLFQSIFLGYRHFVRGENFDTRQKFMDDVRAGGFVRALERHVRGRYSLASAHFR